MKRVAFISLIGLPKRQGISAAVMAIRSVEALDGSGRAKSASAPPYSNGEMTFAQKYGVI